MAVLVKFALLAALLVGPASALRLPSFWTHPVRAGPDYCRDHECPAFTKESEVSEDTELRAYAATQWVSTNVTGPSMDLASTTGFMRLYKYITGFNAANQTIDMTVPVRVRVPRAQLLAPDANNVYTVSFFLSPSFTKENPAPAPRCKHVFLESEPATDLVVKSYSGFSTELSVKAKSDELARQLDDLGMSYDDATVYFAGYDSPFRLLWRHNEVWVRAKSMAAAADKQEKVVL